jgi:hypothetical protein
MKNLPKHWTTKDKRNVLIREMADSHLQNTINYMIRIAPAAMEEELYGAFAAAASFDSDSVASYYADAEIASMSDECVEDFLDRQPKFRALRNEAKRRGLPDPVFP